MVNMTKKKNTPTSNTSAPPPGHACRVTKRPYPDSRPMQ